MSIQDRIERVVILPVSRERAWAAITEPEQISKWFAQSVEMELREGADAVYRWGEAEVGRFRIAAVDPPRRFAYRWHPGSGEDHSVPFEDQPLTLVEFLLEEVPVGTRLTLIESGFAALPPEHFERIWRENNQGWDSELVELMEYTRTLAPA